MEDGFYISVFFIFYSSIQKYDVKKGMTYYY